MLCGAQVFTPAVNQTKKGKLSLCGHAYRQACLADIWTPCKHDVLQLAQVLERQDALIGDLGERDEVQPFQTCKQAASEASATRLCDAQAFTVGEHFAVYDAEVIPKESFSKETYFALLPGHEHPHH